MAQTQHRPNQTAHSAPKTKYPQKRWVIGSLGLLPPLGIALVLMAIANPAPEAENLPVAEQPVTTAILETPVVSQPVAEQPVKPTVAKAPAAPPAPQPKPAKPAPAVPPAAYKQAIALATTATQDRATATTSEDWAKIADTWQTSMNALNEISDGGSFAAQARSKQKEYQINYEFAIAQMNAALVTERKASAQQQRWEQEERFAQRQREAAAAARIQAALPAAEESGGYVSGSCSSLRARGVGSNFRPGDANYTSGRDRDGDGVACES